MFADIVKFISLNNLSKNAQFIIFGGTVIVDEPICKDKPEYYFTNCVDNWVIKENDGDTNNNEDNNKGNKNNDGNDNTYIHINK